MTWTRLACPNRMIISDNEFTNSTFQFASSSNPRRSTWPKANKEAIGRPRNPKRRRSKSLLQHQAKRVRDGIRPSLTPKGNRNGSRHLTRCREIHRSAFVRRLHVLSAARQLNWPLHVIDTPPRISSRVRSSTGTSTAALRQRRTRLEFADYNGCYTARYALQTASRRASPVPAVIQLGPSDPDPVKTSGRPVELRPSL
jgi:hypothetical protein